MVATDTFYIKVYMDDILHEAVIVKGKCAIMSLNLWVFLPLVAFMK